MKFFTLLITIIFFTAGSFAQGVLEIKKPTVELKNLKADDQPTVVTFQIKNTGNQPVIISRITPFSSALKAEWVKEPLAPGKTGEIRISFSTVQMPESFDYKIMLYSNARNNRAELHLQGNIIDNPAKPTLLYKYDMNGLKFKSSSVSFNKIYTWQIAKDTVTFYNATQKPVSLSIQYKPQHLETEFVPAQVEPGKQGTLIITYDAPKKNDYGYDYESLILSINNERNYNNRLSVTANLVEDFSKLGKKELEKAPVAVFDKKEQGFGNIKPGEKANCDFTLTNTGKSELIIRKTKASCGCTAVTLGQKSIAPGQSTVIRTTFDSKGKSGRQYKTITVITNDPKNPETLLTINGNITN